MTFTEDDFRSDLGKQDNEFSSFLQRPELYRVKVLDNKDIEETGFKFFKQYKSKIFPFPIDVFKDEETNLYLSKLSNSLFIRIHSGDENIKRLKYIDNVGQTFYMGNIKNKSELNNILETFS